MHKLIQLPCFCEDMEKTLPKGYWLKPQEARESIVKLRNSKDKALPLTSFGTRSSKKPAKKSMERIPDDEQSPWR